MASEYFKDYYEILEVHRRASPEIIKKAYYTLAQKYHPDKRNFEENYAKQMMQEINEAYEILRDPEKKAHYDNTYDFADASVKGSAYSYEEKTDSEKKNSYPTTAYEQKSSKQKYFNWVIFGVITATVIFLVHSLANKAANQPPDIPQQVEERLEAPPTDTNKLPNKPQQQAEDKHPNQPPNKQQQQIEDGLKPPPANTNAITAETPQSLPASSVQSEPKKAAFFTLGSTQNDVRSVMGAPTFINGDTWLYGLSLVHFNSDGKVCGWSEINKHLKVSVGERDSNATFTTGSSKSEVIKAMGTPTGIKGNTWSYGLSVVYFNSDNKVSKWFEINRDLNTR